MPSLSETWGPASADWAATDEPWVERVSGLGKEEFRQRYLLPRRPVIVTDATRDWPANRRYTFDYFRREHGHRKLRVQGREQRLDDVIAQLQAATAERPGPYPCTLPGDPSLHEDLNPRFDLAWPTRTGSALVPSGIFRHVNHLELFFGAPGGQFPRLHYDHLHLHTFVNQVHGDKEFTIYAPGQEELLHVNPAMPWLSMVKNVEDPDPVQFPRLREARRQTVIVKAGETLFIPCGVWHTARCVTDCITVAFDHLESSNWSEFVSDAVAVQKMAGQPVKAVLLGLWLRLAGPMIGLGESLQGRRQGHGWD